ncbi:rhomboid family intramembrane serine protease [Halioxenophilus aromaticivorans]|uniref:rhomboid family intramembrane serine protease n=1 Tax=Halioxenophilus aromaticivorans TaxID=1306992 RepID=UPI0031E4F167
MSRNRATSAGIGRSRVLITVVAVLIAVHLLNMMSGGVLVAYGIFPRQLGTLPHIITAPAIHGDVSHLLNNLIGFLIFASLCLFNSVSQFVRASVFIIFLSGLLVWLLGRPAWHIGASGWVYGLWSFAIFRAWYHRSLTNCIAAMVALCFYGVMLYGILPAYPGVSFESHLFGAIAGVIAAALITQKGRRFKFL